jgi:hypothetical protein
MTDCASSPSSTHRSSTAAPTACACTSTGRSAGLGADEIAQLPAWRESGVFSARERAALELAECYVFIHDEGIPDEVYDRVGGILSEEEYVALSWLLVSINAFNRITIAGKYPLRRAAASASTASVDDGARGCARWRDQLPRHGGLPAADGVTRAGVLYRSANLARLTTEGARRSALSACAASSTCAPTTRSRRAESRRGSRARRRAGPAVPRLRGILLRP